MGYVWHLKRLLAVGVPLMGSHMAQLAIQLTDTLMLGRYGVEALAGQVLGSQLFFLLMYFGSGFGWAVLPMVAEAEARGETRAARRVTRMGLWLSAGFAALALPPMLASEPLFRALGQEAGTAALAGDYLRIGGWAIVPALFVMVMRSFLSGLELTRAVLVAALVAVVANAVTNYALIFGNWGAPEMGVRGAAWASLVSMLAQAAGLAVYAHVAAPEHAVFRRLWAIDREALGAVFRLGWPIGVTTLAEVSLFVFAAVMMGWISTVALAAHGIAMQIITVVFVLHVGLSQAATIRAGNAQGRGDRVALRAGAGVALGVSQAIAMVTVVVLLSVPEPLVALFLSADEPAREAVIATGRGLLAAAALFQVFDAGQVMALGLLRGVQDTRVPMALAAISYGAVGLPAAWVFAFPVGGGAVGLWLGMAMGLAVAAATLLMRFWQGAYAKGSAGYPTSAR